MKYEDLGIIFLKLQILVLHFLKIHNFTIEDMFSLFQHIY